MLLSLTVGNYKSLRDKVTLSLEPLLPKSKFQENIYLTNKFAALKCAVLYGANASGKSNILSSLSFIKHLVLNSARDSQVGMKISVEPFKLLVDNSNPSFFEVEFVVDEIKYRYGFESNQSEVVSEWLFYSRKNVEFVLYVRENQNIDVNEKFKEGNQLVEKTRPNALFLSVAAQFNGEISTKILSWFNNLNTLSGLNDSNFVMYTISQLDKPEMKSKIVDWLKQADTNIVDIEKSLTEMTLEELPESLPFEIHEQIKKSGKQGVGIHLNTVHNLYDVNNNIVGNEILDFNKDESEGTKKFFSLSGPIIDTLQKGKVLIVDELDARLHPLLTKIIVKWFNSDSYNKNGAQLVFATHDTNLLSTKTIRRDQIFFTEKNRGESTTLYSLAEYIMPGGKGKPRQDASWENHYIKGRYGAIPFIGDFDKILKNL